MPTGSASFPLITEATDVAPRTPPPSALPPPHAAAPVVPARASSPPPVWTPAPAPVAPDRDRAGEPERSISDDWMLSIEGATHAPLDVGFLAGFETPAGLRLFGGYGWIPGAYMGLVTDVVAASAGADAQATALLQHGFQGGHVWRLQGGIRPFRKLGLYLDAGYSRVTFEGSVDAADVPGAAALGVSGGYALSATLDMWLVELGYQAHLGDHVVVAIGAGVMGTFNAKTNVSPTSGSVGLPTLDSATTTQVDQMLEQNGYLPTLTLRLGFDLI